MRIEREEISFDLRIHLSKQICLNFFFAISIEINWMEKRSEENWIEAMRREEKKKKSKIIFFFFFFDNFFFLLQARKTPSHRMAIKSEKLVKKTIKALMTKEREREKIVNKSSSWSGEKFFTLSKMIFIVPELACQTVHRIRQKKNAFEWRRRRETHFFIEKPKYIGTIFFYRKEQKKNVFRKDLDA